MTEAVEESVAKATARAPEVRHEMLDPAPRFIGPPTMTSGLIWAAFVGAVLAFCGGIVSSSQAYMLASAALAALAGVAHAVVYSRARAPKMVRRFLVRLPVLRSDEIQRIGALAGCAATTCGRCESWNREEGQRFLVNTPFGRMGAHQLLSPQQMQKTRSGTEWKAENGFDENGRPLDEPGPQWSELGMCSKKQMGVFAPHTCKDWS